MGQCQITEKYKGQQKKEQQNKQTENNKNIDHSTFPL